MRHQNIALLPYTSSIPNLLMHLYKNGCRSYIFWTIPKVDTDSDSFVNNLQHNFSSLFDMAIGFISIQLGSLGSLIIIKSLLQGSHFWIPVIPVFYSLNCNSDIKTEEGSLGDEIASYQNLYQLLTYLQKCCHKVVDPEGALKCAWSKKSFL